MKHPLSAYTSPAMVELWTPEAQVEAERWWWYHIARWLYKNTDVYAHIDNMRRKLNAYREAIPVVDLSSIQQREKVTKHDVKARIEEFNHRAARRYWFPFKVREPLELIHWGMTSADVVDNISLIKIRRSLEQLMSYAPDNIHGTGFWHLDNALNILPLRGLKGPVGTQQDMLDLVKDPQLVDALEAHLASTYGFDDVLNSVGQVYPRSLDYQTAIYVAGAVGGIQPWRTILNGYMSMMAEYSGDQWNEGDVSTSVVRRVALPGIFMAADAALRGVEP